MSSIKPRVIIEFVPPEDFGDYNFEVSEIRDSMKSVGAIDPQFEQLSESGARVVPELVAGIISILTAITSEEVIAAVSGVVVAHVLRGRERTDYPITVTIKVDGRIYKVSGSSAEEIDEKIREIERLIKEETSE